MSLHCRTGIPAQVWAGPAVRDCPPARPRLRPLWCHWLGEQSQVEPLSAECHPSPAGVKNVSSSACRIPCQRQRRPQVLGEVYLFSFISCNLFITWYWNLNSSPNKAKREEMQSFILCFRINWLNSMPSGVLMAGFKRDQHRGELKAHTRTGTQVETAIKSWWHGSLPSPWFKNKWNLFSYVLEMPQSKREIAITCGGVVN